MPGVRSPRVILVVDDEPVVLNIVCRTLAQAGFEVLSAASPEAALRLAAHQPAPIDLLLADVIMPGMSGPTLADRFQKLYPETPCLFMAGLADTTEVIDRIITPGRPFLLKPFVPMTLLDKVNEVLDKAARRHAAASV